MAVTAFATGTQTATVTTEHFLSSVNEAGVFTLHVDLSNMVAGDYVELRVYQMVLTGGTARVAYLYPFQGLQSVDNLIAISTPIPNDLTDSQALRFSLKQTLGTSRQFAWKVLKESVTEPLTAAGVRSAVGLASANLDTQLSTIDDFLDTEIAAILAAVDTEVAAIKAKTDNLPAAPAATGDIPTANQNADALLDRASGVETSYTPRQALRLILAALAGKLSGAATTTIAIRDVNDSKDRITATVDSNGNRTAITTDVS